MSKPCGHGNYAILNLAFHISEEFIAVKHSWYTYLFFYLDLRIINLNYLPTNNITAVVG